MTTSDNAATTENVENATTIEGIIEQPRSIDTLLKASTYQGMTDEEIARIIAYKEEQARKEEANALQAEAVREQTDAMRAHWKEQADKAEAAFNSAIYSVLGR